MGRIFTDRKAGKRLAHLFVGAVYYFLFAKPRDLLLLIAGRPRRRLVVLCYHGVRPEDRSAFAWQMDALLRTARPASLQRWVSTPEIGNLVAVTFDDGFANVRQNALPELERRGIPATIFVPTGNLGGHPTWSMEKKEQFHEERILEAKDLRTLAGPNLDFGSHSVSHADLTKITEEEILRELSRSKEDLEEILGAPVDLFAFPYGAYSDRAAELARMAGYRMACTLHPKTVRFNDYRFLVGRFRVDPCDWKIEFWLKIRGAYEGVAPFQRLKRFFRNPTRKG
jgi:peptidoglycan/xylan/chitin deacetylase (PgdA/CDA1 family)